MILIRKRVGIGRIAIVAIVIVIFVVAGGAYLATTMFAPGSSSTTTTSSSSSAQAPYKIVLVTSWSSDSFFNEVFVAGAQAAAADLSTSQQAVQFTADYDVPTSQTVSVCQQYAAQGYKLILLLIDNAGNYAATAKALPNVLFGDETIFPNGYNATTYNFKNPDSNVYSYNQTNTFGWYQDENGAYYVAGVAAALASKTQKIGDVTGFAIPYMALWYYNIAAGVHSVNSSAPVYYGFTSDWSDPTKGAAVTDTLVAKGADVIIGTGDTQALGAMKEAISKNVYAVAYTANFNNESSRWMLGSVLFNSTGLSIAMFQDALKGNTVGHFYDLDLGHHGNAFVLNPALVSSGVLSQADVTRINQAAQQVADYTISACASGCTISIGGPVSNTFPPEPP